MNFLFDPKSETVEPKYGLIVGHVQKVGKLRIIQGLSQELQTLVTM